MTRVLIAGGGVAAVEAMLALHALAEDRVEIELLGPEPHFWYRPLSVAEPFVPVKAGRHEVGALVAAAGGGTFTLGTLQGIDAARHEATTSVGEIGYDIALIAVGAVPTQVVPGALTFRGPADDEKIRGLLRALSSGATRRVVFAVPPGASWPLPLYELALMTGSDLQARGIDDAELVLVTPEEEPLQLFGHPGGDVVRRLLEERGISVRTRSSPVAFADHQLRLTDGQAIETDCVVTLPQLRGPALAGLPATSNGFIPVDVHGRVEGCEDVYAAGDVVDFPVRQGGIAAQFADAAAEAIAAQAGADVEPRPFRPVLRALLLTGAEPLYLRRRLPGAGHVATVAVTSPSLQLTKIRGRYLAPFLRHAGGELRVTRPGLVTSERTPG
jgi:sulfide:quinone oxidoreductase